MERNEPCRNADSDEDLVELTLDALEWVGGGQAAHDGFMITKFVDLASAK